MIRSMYMLATVWWLETWTGGVTRDHCHVQAPTRLPLVHMILFFLMMLPTTPPLRRAWRRGISGSGWSCRASVEKLAPPGTQFLARCLGGLGLIFPFFHSFNLYVCKKKKKFFKVLWAIAMGWHWLLSDWIGLVCVRGGRDEQEQSIGLSFPMERRA